ncbi:MAG: pantoate--beta-alanine ligase [Clostridiales Family XIII bacterium]|jgi:pantoate--beta-alanine ligase|nr:pantoate--beta-alanine ligase [Clostridiales Family XIII bacterium]
MTTDTISSALCTTIAEAHGAVFSARMANRTIGLVPTMGALHEGHLSLIRRAAAENGFVVVSVFVNPIQFDDAADFVAYPHTIEEDAALAIDAGADAVFAPSAKEMYPDGFSSYIDMGGITERLCGAARKAHFRGVCTVVGKLFHIVQPDRAYFGEKDAQQLAVVRKMVRDLNFPIRIVGCPTVREPDGLAMSSRNARLSQEERKAARCLFRALSEACRLFAEEGARGAAALTGAMRGVLAAEPLARAEYVEIVDPETFASRAPEAAVHAGDRAMLAVHVGGVRLIDNMELTETRETLADHD